MIRGVIKRSIYNKNFILLLLFSIVLGIEFLFKAGSYRNFGICAFVITGPDTYKSEMSFLYYIFNPLFISIVASKAFYEDMNSGLYECLINREDGRKKYFQKMYISSLIMGGIVSILPILIVAVFLMTNVPYIPSDCFVLVKKANLFTAFVNSSPTLYIFLSMIPFFIYGCMISAITLVSKVYINSNKNIELMIPFLITVFIEFCGTFFYDIKLFHIMNYFNASLESILGIIAFILCPFVVFNFFYNMRVIKYDIF